MPTKSPPKDAPRDTSSRTALLIGLIALGVAVAIIVSVILSRGGDDGGAADAVDQTSEVTIDGGPLPFADDPANDPAVGQPAPALQGTDFDGNEVSFTPGGTDQMLVFLAHWCPHCQNEVPVLTDWLNSGAAPEGLEVTTVSTGVDPDRDNYPPSAWLEREGWSEPVIRDDAEGSAADTYGLVNFPYFVIVDEDGNIKLRVSGEVSAEQLTALVEQALAA